MRLLNLLAMVLVYLVMATGLAQVRGGRGPWWGTAHVLPVHGQRSTELEAGWELGAGRLSPPVCNTNSFWAATGTAKWKCNSLPSAARGAVLHVDY